MNTPTALVATYHHDPAAVTAKVTPGGNGELTVLAEIVCGTAHIDITRFDVRDEHGTLSSRIELWPGGTALAPDAPIPPHVAADWLAALVAANRYIDSELL